MSSTWKPALFLSLTLMHAGSQAQIYVCKDAGGRTLSADRPLLECGNRSMRELDKQGRTRREIPPPMTAEEKRQLALQEERRKAEEAAAEERRREDRLLKARYRSEEEIEEGRKRAIELVEEQVKRERAQLARAEEQQGKSEAETAMLRKKNIPIPAALQRQLDDDMQFVESTMKRIGEYDAEIAQVNARYEAILKRYRELAVAN